MGAATYDFIVIGGGSAGFNAAQAAAGLGLKVAVVDGARRLGGLCILAGCMPSKTLIYAAETLHRAQTGGLLGLRIPRAEADMKAVQARKRRIIADFAGHRRRQIENGPFAVYRSPARFTGPRTIELGDGRRLHGRRFLIATGSKVGVPPVPGLKGLGAWTSDEVLDLDVIPRSVLVLGGGVVACELAQYLSRIGARVTMIQRSPQILRDHSAEAARVVQDAFADEGIEVFTGTTIQSLARAAGRVRVSFIHRGRKLIRSTDHCLNALGRVANTAALGLDTAGVRLRPNGRIAVNRWQQTSAPHIYAAGDCAGPVEIVHLAIEQGIVAARHAAGAPGVKPVDYGRLLSIVFTDPPLASLGRLERDLDAGGTAYLCASYPFNDHGKSILMEATRGYVKVIAEPVRGRILGAEIVGPDAGELIHCLSGPLAMRATVFDLLRAPWYHPTLAEIITYPLEEIAGRILEARRGAQA
jgi:pyruvate/2-oxoglutarate dehydrogenase complex dihydrolipoamide dehydrogenase (E3) component